MNIENHEVVVCRIRDLIHHYGVHHPSVQGTQAGNDLSTLGTHIPAMFRGDLQDNEREALAAVFLRNGWESQAITLEAVLDLADSLMLPPFDTLQRLDFRLRSQSATPGKGMSFGTSQMLSKVGPEGCEVRNIVDRGETYADLLRNNGLIPPQLA